MSPWLALDASVSPASQPRWVRVVACNPARSIAAYPDLVAESCANCARHPFRSYVDRGAPGRPPCANNATRAPPSVLPLPVAMLDLLPDLDRTARGHVPVLPADLGV